MIHLADPKQLWQYSDILNFRSAAREKSNRELRDVKHPSKPEASEAAAPELQPRQRAVIAMLASGRSISEIASSAHVARCTIHRWLRDDPHFRAAYNRWRRELDVSARSKLMAAADSAADAVRAAVAAGDAKLAFALLKQMGFLQPPVHGAIDPANAAIEQQNESDRERIDVRQVRSDNDTQATTCGISVSWKTPKVPPRAELDVNVDELLALPGEPPPSDAGEFT